MKNSIRMKKIFVSMAFCCAISGVAYGQVAYETPTMGWSSWNTYRVNISEELIKRQADAMIESGLSEVGYRFINIDDGYFGGRDEEGKLVSHPKRFPNGLRPVVDHIHQLGLKAGIYSDAGRNTCGSYWDADTLGIGVGLYGHDLQDARYFFEECGFDFIKIDFCGGHPQQNFEKLELDERERYTAIRQAIDSVGRPDVRVNICRWAYPGTWVSQVGDSWRIAYDIHNNWKSVKSIIDTNRYLSAYAFGGHYNDMDMLEIGRGLSEAEERTHFGMWCMMSSPLLIGCDLTKIPESSLTLLKNTELIALNQDPLGLQAYQVRNDGGVGLFVKDVQRLIGPERAVALYNSTDQEREFVLHFSEVDLGGKVEVRDLFTHSSLGEFISGKLIVRIPPHDTRIFRLKGELRYERQTYEAEHAWLDSYQCLSNPLAVGSAYYVEAPSLSGGAKVTGIGNTPENGMEWRDVYSANGGDYWMHVNYQCSDIRQLSCRVNDGIRFSLYVSSGAEDIVGKCRFHIRLNPGFNRIRFFSTKGKCPDIDVMRLERIM